LGNLSSLAWSSCSSSVSFSCSPLFPLVPVHNFSTRVIARKWVPFDSPGNSQNIELWWVQFSHLNLIESLKCDDQFICFTQTYFSCKSRYLNYVDYSGICFVCYLSLPQFLFFASCFHVLLQVRTIFAHWSQVLLLIHDW